MAGREWVESPGGPDDVQAPFAAGIPRKVRVVYFYRPTFPWENKPIVIKALEEDVSYVAFFWDPRSGERHELGSISRDDNGCRAVPLQPTLDDWVVVLEAEKG